MDGPAQSPSPSSTAKTIQFRSLVSAVTLQPLISLNCSTLLHDPPGATHQLHLVSWIPQLHLNPPSLGLHLGPLTHWLHLGSTLPRLHPGLSSLRLPHPFGFTLGLGLPSQLLHLPPFLWLRWAPPSLWFLHGLHSHRLCPGLPSPCLHLSHTLLQLHFVITLALRLHLGLHLYVSTSVSRLPGSVWSLYQGSTMASSQWRNVTK